MFCLFSVLGILPEGKAQERPTCATTEYSRELQKQQPALIQKQEQLSRSSEKLIRGESVQKLTSAVIQIPVVVHVVYRTDEENISEEQIRSQIRALNEDFRRINPDTLNTPDFFKGLAADTRIEFCLAVRDPADNPSKGITRTRTTVGSFRTDNAIKFTRRGGQDAWDPTSYLNIWVGNVGSLMLGYAQFPGGPVQTDGVVIGYEYFGRQGTARAPFNRGRTTTHEVGHWLNLQHIWGDSRCGDDGVDDTPTQEKENYNCPGYPRSSCGNTSDMFMNFMDYTEDGCMNLFTLGQRARIRAAVQLARPGLLTSQGCVPVPEPLLDASVFAITSPLPFFCQPDFTPVVVLKNTGRTPLTSATITYQLNGGSPQTFQWTGNLNPFQSAPLTLPTMQVGPGSHTFTATVGRPNNGPDEIAENNTLVSSFQTVRQEPGLPLPLREGFESAIFPPAGWELVNPDGRQTWERTSKAAKAGTASATVQNFSYENAGEVDELVLPAVDLTSHFGPRLTFDLAYSLYDNRGFTDTLEVLLSTDCGVTYTSIYKKYGLALVTGREVATQKSFVPSPSEWRTETIDLDAFSSFHNVVLKFRNITDFENNLYLDEIQVKGIPEINLFPNPTSGRAELQIPAYISPDVEVDIIDLTGRVILRKNKADFDGSILRFDLSGKATGIYLVRVRNGSDIVVRRVLVTR